MTGRARRRLALAPVGALFAPLAVLAVGAASVAAGVPEEFAGCDLTYEVRLVHQPALGIEVRLATLGRAGGQTTFEVSRDWGGVDAGGDDIAAVSATDARGRTLAVEHPEPHRWRVRHAPGESLRVAYAFHPNAHQGDASPSVHRRPILNDHLFHAYGELAMLRPSHLDPKERRHIGLVWAGFQEAGWRVACSFGVGPAPRRIEASLDEWREAVFLAGDLEILQRDIEARPVYVAIAGHEWSFTNDEFADLVESIVALERGFFLDYDYPFYLVSVVPVGDTKTGRRSLGGTGLTNSFSIAMLPGTGLEGDFGRTLGVEGLLAHEMFHNWAGHRLAPSDPEQLVYWFTEGFTSFYTRRLLLRGGLIGRDEYVRSLNATLAKLLASPVRDAPNERIRTDFWRDPGVRRLPYLRGDVVALLVDAAIRRASGGDDCLDDLMRDLVATAGGRRLRVGTDDLLQRFEDLTDEATAEQIRRIVVQGVVPEIDPSTLAPCLQLRSMVVARFELGFDLEKARTQHLVAGVVPDSKAAQAGLQDGQKIVGWSVQMGDAASPVTITVANGDAERTIIYLPARDGDPLPQFLLLPDASEADCSIL